MVEAARRRAADLGLGNIEAHAMDAERLELPDAASTPSSAAGLMLMADPAACLAEALRVLRPGGRLAAAVWGAPADNPWPEVVAAYSSAKACCQLRSRSPGSSHWATRRGSRPGRRAGLAAAVVERIPASWGYTGEDEYWRVQTSLSTSTATDAGARSTPTARRRSASGWTSGLPAFRTADGLELPGVSLGVAARRPL